MNDRTSLGVTSVGSLPTASKKTFKSCAYARPVGDRWFVDETHVKVAGHWRYVYRAVDQHGQVLDV